MEHTTDAAMLGGLARERERFQLEAQGPSPLAGTREEELLIKRIGIERRIIEREFGKKGERLAIPFLLWLANEGECLREKRLGLVTQLIRGSFHTLPGDLRYAPDIAQCQRNGGSTEAGMLGNFSNGGQRSG